MINYYWFSVFVAANALLLLVLATNVSLMRLKYKISYGDGDNKDLFRAIRVHANGIEQVPIFALLLLGLSFSSVSSIFMAGLVVAFTCARISHACGMLFSIHQARRAGAGFTYLLQAVAVVALLIYVNG